MSVENTNLPSKSYTSEENILVWHFDIDSANLPLTFNALYEESEKRGFEWGRRRRMDGRGFVLLLPF